MNEVKAREDEYDHLKSLSSRIRGLPLSFTLARRDRKLIAHGAIRRIHIGAKDRAALDMETVASLHRTASAHRLRPGPLSGRPMPVHAPRSFESALPTQNRPISTGSDT